jgi:hypothetical protein
MNIQYLRGFKGYIFQVEEMFRETFISVTISQLKGYL